jgi:NADH dehydrogenase
VSGPAGDERIAARTVLWAAGVRASSLGASLGVPRDNNGRVHVLPDLSIPGHPEVFVVGDLARVDRSGSAGPRSAAAGRRGESNDGLPGVSQVAMQGGRHVAGIIKREVTSGTAVQARPAFRYHDKGNMATIGRADAVIATKHFARSGFWAWLLWWAVHIYFLIGFRNRTLVFLNWAWSWLTYKRDARLITGSVGALPAVTDEALPPPPTGSASPPTSTPASREHR